MSVRRLRRVFVLCVVAFAVIWALIMYSNDSSPKTSTENLRYFATSSPSPTKFVLPPRKNIYFMKTHKTGSSTLQNILVRYAWDHDLLIGLPMGDLVYGSYYKGNKFSPYEMQPLPRNRNVNMLLHHMVFDRKRVSSVLPSDAIYVTIMRDPATLYQSAFYYFKEDSVAFERAQKDGVEKFFSNPKRYFRGSSEGNFWWLAKNAMFFDLGFDNMNETNEYIRQSVSSLDNTFHLVMISEYFDMGLILLKDLMHWTIKDVVYVTMNARKSRTKKKPYSMRLKQRIYLWNKADAALYKYYNQTFWDRVKAYGEEKMNNELKVLQFWKDKFAEYCYGNKLIANTAIKVPELKLYQPPGIKLMQHRLKKSTKNNETCIGFILPEVEWWKKLSQKQRSIIVFPTTPSPRINIHDPKLAKKQSRQHVAVKIKPDVNRLPFQRRKGVVNGQQLKPPLRIERPRIIEQREPTKAPVLIPMQMLKKAEKQKLVNVVAELPLQEARKNPKSIVPVTEINHHVLSQKKRVMQLLDDPQTQTFSNPQNQPDFFRDLRSQPVEEYRRQ